MNRVFFLILLCVIHFEAVSKRSWEKGELTSESGIENPFNIAPHLFLEYKNQGEIHALNYPVENTGILLPYTPIKRLIEGESSNPLKKLISGLIGVVTPFKSFDDLEDWLGLIKYPENENDQVFPIPAPSANRPSHRMGLTFKDHHQTLSFTLSCAQCHSSNLFGKRILGLSNRFPRANEFFEAGIKATPFIGEGFFKWATNATNDETLMFHQLKKTTPFIAAKKPVQLGLDTSLAQVSLSLSKRAKDPYATKKRVRSEYNFLSRHIADSKPMVWWNVKYKNRWLSDGSVVSGNPIFTNIIWNEIGRGADLLEIEEWLAQNEKVIEELTTAVFSNEAPHITDFYEPSVIDELMAQKGEKLFNQTCASCHGVYQKNWSLPWANSLEAKERLKTFNVKYPKQTFVVDVGTDPGRHQGMKGLLRLNELSISQKNGIVIEPQKGYVPPPLVGIWARFPYFHNNSVPTLCDVLTEGRLRPVTYWARPLEDQNLDYDLECGGYPKHAPRQRHRDYYYDTRRKGMSRLGHDEGVFLREGREIFSLEEKKQLVMFLKTL